MGWLWEVSSQPIMEQSSGTRWLKVPLVGWLLEFYVFGTSKVITGGIPTCHSVRSWRLYNAAPLGNQVTMTQYPTQSCYSDTELTSSHPILLLPSARLRSYKYKFCKSLVWLDRKPNSQSPACEARTLLISPLCHVLRVQSELIVKDSTGKDSLPTSGLTGSCTVAASGFPQEPVDTN